MQISYGRILLPKSPFESLNNFKKIAFNFNCCSNNPNARHWPLSRGYAYVIPNDIKQGLWISK